MRRTRADPIANQTRSSDTDTPPAKRRRTPPADEKGQEGADDVVKVEELAPLPVLVHEAPENESPAACESAAVNAAPNAEEAVAVPENVTTEVCLSVQGGTESGKFTIVSPPARGLGCEASYPSCLAQAC